MTKLKSRYRKDNKNQIFIKDCQLHNLYEVVVDGSKVEIVERIKKARKKNEEVIKVVEKMKKANIKILREDEWETEEELVLKEENVYILKNEKLRAEII